MNKEPSYFQKENARPVTRMQAPLGERQLVTELSEELDLPDYQPEIKRLLRVRAEVMPADAYIGAGNAECTGAVEYSVLYAAGDGMLYCATCSGSYRFAFPVELTPELDAGEGLLCDVDSQPESVTGRVTAPRKLTLRCRLRTRAQLWGTRVLPDPAGQTADLQRLMGQCEAAHLFLATGEPLVLGDEIVCDPKDGDIRVISAEGRVLVSEAVAGSGTVSCRGEVCLRLLCSYDATGTVCTLQRRIPFSQSVEADGVEVNCEACADGVCQDVRVTVEEGRIACDVTVCLRTRAQRNEAVSYLKDAYSTQAECETTVRSLEVPVALRSVCGNASLNAVQEPEEVGARAGMRPVDVDGSVVLTGVEQARGKYYLLGKCRLSVLMQGEADWSVQELELPLRYEVDGAASGMEITAAELRGEVLSCRVRADGERLGVDAEVAVCGTLRGTCGVRVLTDLQCGAAWQAPNAIFTVCYPGKTDTLWSVAKRYHTPVSALTAKNALAQAPAADATDSLAGVSFLLV